MDTSETPAHNRNSRDYAHLSTRCRTEPAASSADRTSADRRSGPKCQLLKNERSIRAQCAIFAPRVPGRPRRDRYSKVLPITFWIDLMPRFLADRVPLFHVYFLSHRVTLSARVALGSRAQRALDELRNRPTAGEVFREG
jgi:hypothetical protein